MMIESVQFTRSRGSLRRGPGGKQMAEKTLSRAEPTSAGRTKFIIGGLLIVAAIVYLIASSTQAAAQYYLTVDELKDKGDVVAGRDLKISGAGGGDSIPYDGQTLTLKFTIANVPADPNQIEQE